jgi:predicted nuclease with TOPRIM domain
VGELRGELLASEGARRQLSQQAEALREELDTAQAGRDALREELKQFESQASSLYSDVSSWKVERARLQGARGPLHFEFTRHKQPRSIFPQSAFALSF